MIPTTSGVLAKRSWMRWNISTLTRESYERRRSRQEVRHTKTGGAVRLAGKAYITRIIAPSGMVMEARLMGPTGTICTTENIGGSRYRIA